MRLAALVLIAFPLAAQKPAKKAPAKPGTLPAAASQPADTAAPKDSVTRFLESFGYRNLGPAAYSGRVTALAVANSGSTPSTIYVGAAGGGVWKTSNGGITWRSVGDALGTQSVGDLAVAPSDSSIVWVGTGEKNSLRSQWWGDGVYKSTNGGKSWTNMGLTETRQIGRVVIHPTNPDIVYVAALGRLWGPNPDRGIYKTTDGGKTWSQVLFVDDTTGFVDLEMDPANPEVLYAAAWHRLRWGGSRMEGVGKGSGIYKTTDGGKTWTRLTDPARKNGLPTERMGRIGIAVAPKDPGVVYAMIQVDRGMTNAEVGRFGGVFRSADAGASWTQVNDLQAVPHYYYDDVWVDPQNSDHVFITASPLLESRDGGKSFAPDSLHRVHVDNHALWLNPADSMERWLGNDGGVYHTRDGGRSWEHMELPIGQFYTVIVDSSQEPYQVCGGLQDNGVWCGPSATRAGEGITDFDWYSVNGGDGMWIQIPPHDPFTVYSEWQFGNISRLDLRTWKRDDITPLELDAGQDSGYGLVWGWTTPILLSSHDSTTLYVGGNHLVRLTHRGDDWQILGPDMTRADRTHPEPDVDHTSYHALFAIAESPRNAGVLWTGSDDGLVWVSQDTGKTWANVTGNLPRGAPADCWVSTITASAEADGTAYLVNDCHNRDDFRPYVYRTGDFGKTWTPLVNGLPAQGGSLTIFEDPANPKLLWVGTATGLYASVDGGARWRPFGKDLPHVPVERIAMSYVTRDLVIGTHGRGIWISNVAALEDWSDSLLAQAAHLFPVAPTYQYDNSETLPSFGDRPFLAANPGHGAALTYYLKDAQSGAVNFLVTTAAGDTIRHFSGPGYAGIQHASWDLMRDKPRPREKGGPTDRNELRRVPPGSYVVHLTVGKAKLEQKVEVRAWPADRLGRVR